MSDLVERLRDPGRTSVQVTVDAMDAADRIEAQQILIEQGDAEQKQLYKTIEALEKEVERWETDWTATVAEADKLRSYIEVLEEALRGSE